MRWIELFLTVVREGLTEPISLEFLLPYTGKERAEIMAEVDKVALYHYKLKVLYEDKLRRRFGRATGQSQADAENDATQVLVNGVVGEISFGELVTGDAIDLAAEETDEESSSEEFFSSEYETGSEDESDDSNGRELEGSSLVNGTTTVRSSSQSMTSPHGNKHQRSTPQASPLSAQPQPAVVRKRSFSLRKSKSMNFFANLSSSRQSDDAPPVPPLPRSKTIYPYASSSKPLPLDPTVHDATELPPPPPPKDTSPVQQQPPQRNASSSKITPLKKKKPAETLNPPELEHIPKLLPVFTEIVSSPSASFTTYRYNIFKNR